MRELNPTLRDSKSPVRAVTLIPSSKLGAGRGNRTLTSTLVKSKATTTSYPHSQHHYFISLFYITILYHFLHEIFVISSH